MDSKVASGQIEQQLRISASRIRRAEREQQDALGEMHFAEQCCRRAEAALVSAESVLLEANNDMARAPGSDQVRLWRGLSSDRRDIAVVECDAATDNALSAKENLRRINTALQKLKLQRDQLVERQQRIAKTASRRQETMIDDDRYAATMSAGHTVQGGIS